MKKAFDYEKFQPIQGIKVNIPRRALLSAAAEELRARKRNEQEGIPIYRIADLAALSNTEFEQIRPGLVQNCKIFLEAGFVYALPPKAADTTLLFALTSPAVKIFNQFNGRKTIAEICAEIATEKDFNAQRAFQFVRGLFLKLTEYRVCEPK